jgi:hypothetical protein
MAPPIQPVAVKAYLMVCERCGAEWYALQAKQPVKCRSCYSPYWQIPPGILPVGRPRVTRDAVLYQRQTVRRGGKVASRLVRVTRRKQ